MRAIVLTLLLGAALFGPAAATGEDRLATIHLPEGFVIEAFAEVPNARQMRASISRSPAALSRHSRSGQVRPSACAWRRPLPRCMRCSASFTAGFLTLFARPIARCATEMLAT